MPHACHATYSGTPTTREPWRCADVTPGWRGCGLWHAMQAARTAAHRDNHSCTLAAPRRTVPLHGVLTIPGDASVSPAELGAYTPLLPLPPLHLSTQSPTSVRASPESAAVAVWMAAVAALTRPAPGGWRTQPLPPNERVRHTPPRLHACTHLDRTSRVLYRPDRSSLSQSRPGRTHGRRMHAVITAQRAAHSA